MKRTEQQIAEFHDLGYLIIPDCFSPEEAALLRDEAESVYRLDRQEVWREKSGAPRTAFAAQTYNQALSRLGRHPPLIQTVEQVIGDQHYIHQYQANPKGQEERRVRQTSIRT